MKSKTFKIVDGDMSDGYHTFDELYEHRVALFLALVKSTAFPCYRKTNHYDGWDAIYLELPAGQISYHVPCADSLSINHRVTDVGDEYEFDGHTSCDVILRIEGL